MRGIEPGAYWRREYARLFDEREEERDKERKLIRFLYDLATPHGCGDLDCCSPLPHDHPLFATLQWAIETTTPEATLPLWGWAVDVETNGRL